MSSRAKLVCEIAIGLVFLVILASWFDIPFWFAARKLYKHTQLPQPNSVELVLDGVETLHRWQSAYLSRTLLSISKYHAVGPRLDQLNQFLTPISQTQQLNAVLRELRTGKFRYIVLLQNDEELRATGGFIGSFATVEINNGVLAPITVTDIYAPAGQLTDFIPPPTGVKEYLSSGKGWGLPDANWSPDFPTSAQTILDFLARAKYSPYRGIFAVNTQLFAQVLEVTGPIYLADQNQTISAENFTQILRADRQTFFAGSYQKVNVLKQLSARLQAKILELPASQKAQLAQIVIDNIRQQNIVAFSTIPDEQAVFEMLGIAGRFPKVESNTLFIAPVESNVGINKVNRSVQRQFELHVTDTQTAELKITFVNRDKYQGYIDYLRLYFSPDTQIEQLQLNGQQVSATSSAVLGAQEVGFLAPVSPNTTATVTAHLKSPPSGAWKNVQIVAQKGTAPVVWKLILPTQTTDRKVDNELHLPLSPQ